MAKPKRRDLPADLIERIREIAAELGEQGTTVKVSDVSRLLLEVGLEQKVSRCPTARSIRRCVS